MRYCITYQLYMKFIVLFICTLIPADCTDVVGKSFLVQSAILKAGENAGQTAATLVHGEGKPISQNIPPEFSAMAAEFIATFFLVTIGCGTAMGLPRTKNSARNLQISLAFSFTMSALIYGIGHYSGGQINPAVTLGLVFTGRTTIGQGILDFIFQLLGALAGSCFLYMIYSPEQDHTGSLAMNVVEKDYGWKKALLAEAIMTFMLVFVVLETATNPLSAENAAMAPAAVGAVVFLAHSLLLPIDGCSVNPARSLAPAIVVKFSPYLPYTNKERFNEMEAPPFADQWVFWVGPMAGALVAAGLSAALMQ